MIFSAPHPDNPPPSSGEPQRTLPLPPPAPTGAEAPQTADLLLKKQLAWSFFLRVMFLSLILGITAILEVKGHRLSTDEYHYPLFFVAGVFLFTIISALWLTRIRQLRRFATCQLIFDILLISSLVLFSGTSQSLFTVVYFLPIIAGSFMLFQRGALLMAASSTLAYGALLLLEYSKYDFNILFSGPRTAVSLERLLNLFAINGLSFFFVAALAGTLAGRLYRTEAELSRTASSFDRLSLLYKQIFDDITTGIVTVDNQRRITSCNRAAEKISGYALREAMGRKVEEVLPRIRPAGDPTAALRAEGEVTRRDGTTLPVAYTWSRLFASEEDHYILSLQDLSLIREMEAKVRQSEKMAAIGEMAAGVAHEFRNPLAAISGSAQLLTQRLQNLPGQEKLLAIITRECDRLESAVRNFLLFSRPALPRAAEVPLRELCRECRNLIRQTPICGPAQRLVVEMAEELTVWADREQLRQILLNLLNNACQAMPKGGEIKCTARPAVHEGRAGVTLQIADQGEGMSPAVREKIFNPYFTTRQDGTGLGLAIVHQLVSGHGGHIEVHSTPGNGTVFTIHLPEKR